MECRTHPSIARAAIFDGMDGDAVARLCSFGRVESFPGGQKLFERGQNADELMILREGVVELLLPIRLMGTSRELAMESRLVGDVLAWSALIHPYQFTLSARCASKCTLLCLPRDRLWAFFESQPQVGYRFMRNLANFIGRRLQATQAVWMRELQVRTA